MTVPPEDRFTPFALEIRAGDSVRWVNNDSDDHTVVSDNALNTAAPSVDHLLPASGGAVTLHFNRPGTFVYYCRFHAQLDSFSQPVAPGPDGGIQDANGNFGTPMSGVVTVPPRRRFWVMTSGARALARAPRPPRSGDFELLRGRSRPLVAVVDLDLLRWRK